MKTRYLLCLLLASAVATACSQPVSDDPPPPSDCRLERVARSGATFLIRSGPVGAGIPVALEVNGELVEVGADLGTYKNERMLAAPRRMKNPVARYGAAAVAHGGYVYVVGGSTAGGLLGQIDRYDPARDEWESFVDGLTRRRYLSAVVHGDDVLIFGGYNESGEVATVEKVSLRAREVTVLAPMPTPRYFGSAEVLDGKVYFAGGKHNDIRQSTVEIYDIAANTWSAGPSLNHAHDTRLVRVDDTLIALGGYAGREIPTVRVVEKLTQGRDEWIPVAPFPQATSAFSAVALSDSVLTFGDYRELGRVLRYNTRRDRWETLRTEFTPRRHSSAAVVGDKAVVFGGNVQWGGSWMNLTEVYELSCP